MSKYRDIASYNLAVKIRSHKTVLVEGTTDKTVLANYFLSRNYADNHAVRYFIDDVSIISGDADLSTLGNRNKVLHVGEKLSVKNEKLGYLIDREWDAVNFQNLDNLEFPQSADRAFLTKGHSIENYWFGADAIISYLQHSVPANITTDFLTDLNSKFSLIIVFSAAYSIASKDGAVIKKSDDLIEYTDIDYGPSGFALHPSFNSKLMARGSNFDLAAVCNSKVAELAARNPEMLKWICHGHLGEQAIRACVARLAMVHGIDTKTLREIERGDKSGKFKHDSKHITSYNCDAVDPLDKLLHWVRDSA
jgi:hypothetical protein